MKDLFLEESSLIKDVKKAKIKYNTYFILSILCYLLAVAVGIVIYFLFDFASFNLPVFLVMVLIPLALFVIVGVLLNKNKNKAFSEYDYSLSSNLITIDLVIARNKRRNYIEFNTDKIVKIGRTDSKEYNKFKDGGASVYDLFADKGVLVKNTYYICLRHNDGKIILNIDCSDNFIKGIASMLTKDCVELK